MRQVHCSEIAQRPMAAIVKNKPGSVWGNSGSSARGVALILFDSAVKRISFWQGAVAMLAQAHPANPYWLHI